MEKLSIDGGKPVRRIGMPPYYPGSTMYDDKEIAGVDSVIASQSPYRFYGPDLQGKVKSFEKRMSAHLGVKNTVAVSSGTAAVIVALVAAGIGPGDKVIVPSCTFIATPGAVVCVGAVPVFAEVDESLSINPDKLEDVIDKDVRAIIPVPILGNPCEMDKIMAVAKKHHLLVIEDCAQSCGSMYHGQYSGTFGDVGAFSLQINKIITTGEGGFVVSNNDKMYERAVRYHDQGMFREKEGFLSSNEEADVFVGQNYRMSEIAGAVAFEQSKKLNIIIDKMRHNKAAIKNNLQGIPGLGFRRINDEDGDCGNCLIFLLDDKSKVRRFNEALRGEGIDSGILYNGQPIYMQRQIMNKMTCNKAGFPFNQFPDLKYTPDMCPDSVDILARNVELMIGPTWTEQDCADVVTAVKKVAAQVL